jgi:hypothetical protein
LPAAGSYGGRLQGFGSTGGAYLSSSSGAFRSAGTCVSWVCRNCAAHGPIAAVRGSPFAIVNQLIDQFANVVMLCAGSENVNAPLDTPTAPSCRRLPLGEVWVGVSEVIVAP